MGLNKDFRVKNGLTVTQDLSVGGNSYLNAVTATTFQANTATFTQTIVSTTSALSVINNGTGPALYVRQSGSNEPIAQFVDHEGGQIIFADTGDVGIGTTSPGSKLHVSGGTITTDINGVALNLTNGGGNQVALEISNATSSGLRLGVNDPYLGNCPALTTNTNSPLLFGANNSEKMRICSSGNVGIGTTSPSEKLTVAGNISASGGLSATGDDNYFSGNVGIGTSTPSELLHIKGGISPTIKL